MLRVIVASVVAMSIAGSSLAQPRPRDDLNPIMDVMKSQHEAVMTALRNINEGVRGAAPDNHSLNRIERTLADQLKVLQSIDSRLTSIDARLGKPDRPLITLYRSSTNAPIYVYGCTNDSNPNCGKDAVAGFCRSMGASLIFFQGFPISAGGQPQRTFEVKVLVCRMDS